MSANLALQKNGTAAVAFTGESLWHRQGTKAPSDVDGRTFLKLAGLDFTVKPVPVVAKGDSDIEIPGMVANVRDDLNTVVGLTSPNYRIFQNVSMIDTIEAVAKNRALKYSVAGALGTGNVCWVLCEIEMLKFCVKNDWYTTYLAVCNSHDGSMNLTIAPTSVRIACANCMRMASKEFTQRHKLYGKSIHAGYRIRHTKNMETAVNDAIAAYDKCLTDAEATKQLYMMLADKPITDKDLKEYFNKMMSVNDEKDTVSKLAESRRANKVDELMKLWESPTNQTDTKGTILAAYNSVVEFADYVRPTRQVNGKSESEARATSALFGSGMDLKDRALLEAIQLAGV